MIRLSLLLQVQVNRESQAEHVMCRGPRCLTLNLDTLESPDQHMSGCASGRARLMSRRTPRSRWTSPKPRTRPVGVARFSLKPNTGWRLAVTARGRLALHNHKRTAERSLSYYPTTWVSGVTRIADARLAHVGDGFGSLCKVANYVKVGTLNIASCCGCWRDRKGVTRELHIVLWFSEGCKSRQEPIISSARQFLDRFAGRILSGRHATHIRLQALPRQARVGISSRCDQSGCLPQVGRWLDQYGVQAQHLNEKRIAKSGP